MPSVFAEVFVLLFLCFWRAFRLYTLLTVSNVPFLFKHLFTYCMIDSDLKRVSFILFHSLLSQFDSFSSGEILHALHTYFAGFL